MESTQPNGDVAAADDGSEVTIPPDNEEDNQTRQDPVKFRNPLLKRRGRYWGRSWNGVAGLQNCKDLAALATANVVRQ